ncbi:3-hydroxyacyl-CoA dehydrogenase [Sedimenticola selenatireducens]|uniref:3-hydroxyacyl-CoA dehydrogenase n=1 Tax=Sedimenticola selenatireducens TaxID=191960 RepID=UPI0004AD63FA|nr:3-hydroxyacyl-CoA dehydrogenase [Sedimenticola selenatireducens]
MSQQQPNCTKAWVPGETLGVVGAGVMGRGIVQVAAQAGIDVVLYDANSEAVSVAIEEIAHIFDRLQNKKKLTPEQVVQALSRISCASDLDAFSSCAVVIEAIVERLDAKQGLLGSLERVVADDCILATNTSSLSVTSIAAGCTRPERVGGFHCFNPVPLMKLVEVIEGVQTEPRVTDKLTALAQQVGHTAVRAQDTPGFVVNHAGRGMITESLRLHSEGVADFRAVDDILRDGVGFRLGPFELMDLTGLDVSQPVMESIYQQYYQEPRYRPTPLALQRLQAGLLGRKSGKGFYTYEQNQKLLAPRDEPLPVPLPTIWVSPGNEQTFKQLSGLVEKLGGTVDRGAKPAEDSLCLLAPLGQDATTAALELGVDPARAIAIDVIPDLDRLRTLMATPATGEAIKRAAYCLFSSDKVPVVMIRESAGFVAQRVLATIINIGCDMAQQRIASPADIDRAVTLGLGYPHGPLAWGDILGANKVVKILTNMHQASQDPRYRVSPWLSRRARLGLSLLSDEHIFSEGWTGATV